MNNYHENIFKGSTEEEIKNAFNQKWLQIIKSCMQRKNASQNCLLKQDKHGIINSTAKQYCSANLEKEELNKYE